MVERGAPPQVSPIRKRLLKSARGLTTPLVPDDYIALMNPMWSTKELRGRISSFARGNRPMNTPSIGLMREGKLIYFMPRSAIESRDAASIAAELVSAFQQHCGAGVKQ